MKVRLPKKVQFSLNIKTCKFYSDSIHQYEFTSLFSQLNKRFVTILTRFHTYTQIYIHVFQNTMLHKMNAQFGAQILTNKNNNP